MHTWNFPQVALTCMAKLRDERFLFPGSLSSDNITCLDLIVVKQLPNGACLTILFKLIMAILRNESSEALRRRYVSSSVTYSGCMVVYCFGLLTFGCIYAVNMPCFLVISSIVRMWLIQMFQPQFFNSCWSMNKIMNILIYQRCSLLNFMQITCNINILI